VNECIHIRTHGDLDLTPELAERAGRLAMRFATEFIDRPRGRHNFVHYEYGDGINCSVHWTKAGAVTVTVWRPKKEYDDG